MVGAVEGKGKRVRLLDRSERNGGASVGVRMRCDKHCKHGSSGHNSYGANNITNITLRPDLAQSPW